MKIKLVSPALLAAFCGMALVSTNSLFAITPPTDFTGIFSGFYAPSQWTTTISGNTSYVAAPAVITSGAPSAAIFLGAIGSGTTPQTGSVLDYSVVLPGSGLVAVSFTYAFFDPVGTGNSAQLLDNGVVVANLTAGGGQIRIPNQFQSGDTLDFRLVSDIVNLPDILEIAPIPEPSTLALAGLSTAAFLLHLRFRSAKR